MFVDSERVSWNMNPSVLEEALDSKARAGRLPRAVILVHIYGQSADLDQVTEICRRYGDRRESRARMMSACASTASGFSWSTVR